MQPFIETFTGTAFRPLAPVLDDIWIEDIAHALSNQCRFSGHVREFYSVAEHSVRVSELLEEWGEDRDVQFWGLLHDASEAYLVDLPTPLKQSEEFGEFYRTAEEQLMRMICNKFGMVERMPDPVKIADAVLLATEARDLMPYVPKHWSNLMVKPMGRRIIPTSPAVSKYTFLQRFHSLFGAR
jgi:5'-deoxynucleotidase YfbR-like HD superfamily hydrolase